MPTEKLAFDAKNRGSPRIRKKCWDDGGCCGEDYTGHSVIRNPKSDAVIIATLTTMLVCLILGLTALVATYRSIQKAIHLLATK